MRNSTFLLDVFTSFTIRFKRLPHQVQKLYKRIFPFVCVTFLGGSGGGIYASNGGYASGNNAAAVVQKHIYVHVPPPEPEEIQPQRQIPVAQAQKHYKIIFIKAPSPPSYQAPIIPVQPQNEEKTLVYVLVKKPEEQQDIVIPTAAPTQPSKPEVYFIKYKTQKESSGGYPGEWFAHRLFRKLCIFCHSQLNVVSYLSNQLFFLAAGGPSSGAGIDFGSAGGSLGSLGGGSSGGIDLSAPGPIGGGSFGGSSGHGSSFGGSSGGSPSR